MNIIQSFYTLYQNIPFYIILCLLLFFFYEVYLLANCKLKSGFILKLWVKINIKKYDDATTFATTLKDKKATQTTKIYDVRQRINMNLTILSAIPPCK